MPDVVVRNVAPYGARMRWPDPTTPGNLTKVTYKGCTSCGGKEPSLGALMLSGMRGLGALDEAMRARPWSAVDASQASEEDYAAVTAERQENHERATARVAGAYGLYYLLTAGTTVAGYVHGYKRNGKSVGWGVAWGVFGLFFPTLALGWMLGQGFGKKG